MLLPLLAAVVVSAIAAITDLRSGTIPNWLTLGAMVAGVAGHAAHGFFVGAWQGALWEAGASLGGLVFCSLAPLLLYWKGGMGGGDLKLFAGIGALCQPMLGIEVQMYSLIIAAIVAPARLAYEGRLLKVLKDSFALLLNPFRREANRSAPPPEVMTWFRLGPAVFAGSVTALAVHGYLARLSA